MPSRRSYLVGAGAVLAATAGCASIDVGGDPARTDGPGTRTSTARPVDPPTGSVTIEDVGVRKAVTYESTTGSGGVLAAEGRQYVVASVTTDREVPSSAFTFEADGDSWEHGHPTTAGGVNSSLAGRTGVPFDYGGHRPGVDAYLAFVVPSPLSASDPRIRSSGEEPRGWKLDADARDRLAAPEPRFELESLSVPEEVTAGEALDVSLEVRNVVETGGRFLTALYWPTRRLAADDESTVVERSVPAGDLAAISASVSTEYTAGEDASVDLEVEGHVAASRRVLFRTR